eukprot:gene3320-13350_t
MLMPSITACQDLTSLHKLISKHSQDFNHAHVCAAMHKVVEASATTTNYEQTALAQQLVEELSVVALGCVHDMDAPALCSVLGAFSRAGGTPGSSLVQKVLHRTEAQLQSFDSSGSLQIARQVNPDTAANCLTHAFVKRTWFKQFNFVKLPSTYRPEPLPFHESSTKIASSAATRPSLGTTPSHSGICSVASHARIRTASSLDTRRSVVSYCTPKEAPPPSSSTKKPTAANTTGSTSEKYAYSDPVNQFLSNFLPPARDVDAELSDIDFSAPKLMGLSLDVMAEKLREGLTSNEWFVTGRVVPTLFSDEFVFKDDSVATTGIKSYALGVRKLFCQETSRAELITVEAKPQKNAVEVVWRLEGRVNLPFRPTIAPYVVTTTLEVDDRGLVNSQLDEFSVPGWKLLAGALLGAWAGPPPAPSVEELRKTYQSKN